MDNLHHKIIGSGPPLVFLHGLFGMLDNWYGFAKGLSDRFTCILVDQRNHGRSFHNAEMNYPVMADDVQRLLDSNWVHEAAVLGHSMGGKTAMQLALDFPDLVSKLIVVDIAPVNYTPSHRREFEAMKDLNPASHSSRGALRDALLANLDPVTTDFLLKSMAREQNGFQWRLGLEEIEQNYDRLILAPTAGQNTYDSPVLFVKGGNSTYIQEDHRPVIENLFPNSELSELSDANHWVHVDAPDQLESLVVSFLEE